MDTVKPGFKTSEFWLSLLAVLLGAVLASGIITSDNALKLLGMASGILATLGYTTQRGFVKMADSKAAAFVEASRAPAVNPSQPST